MNTQFGDVKELESLVEKLDHAEVRGVSVKDTAIDGYKGIWNTSKNELEGIVKTINSDLIQHKDSFMPFIHAVKDASDSSGGEVKIKGSVKDFGGRVIVSAMFSNLEVNAGSDGDKIQLGARLENNYNSPHFRAEGFGFRSFCQNGMFLGRVLTARVSSKHAIQADLEKKCLEFIGMMFDKSTLLVDVIKEAEQDIVKEPKVVEAIFLGEVGGPRTTQKIMDLLEKPDVISRYDMYNAVTNFATHQAKNESQREYYQGTAQRLLTVPIKELNRGELRTRRRPGREE